MTKACKTVSSSEDSKKKKPSKSVGKQTQKNHCRWTQEEDAILLEEVKNNVGNLKRGFKQASERLPLRAEHACAQRWYTQLSTKTGKGSVALMCLSETAVGRNRKRFTTEAPKTNKWMNLWKAITDLFN